MDTLYTIGSFGSGSRSSGSSSGGGSGPVHGEDNVPPNPPANENTGQQRQVERGHRSLSGIIGRIMGVFGELPRHWAVFVGGYYHELIIGRNKVILYQNRARGNADAEGFEFDNVGYTTFNDRAIVAAGI